MTSLDKATVFVTGANGGLGIEFTKQALAHGARRIYATARTPHNWDDPRVVPLTLGVTSAASIRDAAEHAGDTTIVINNAGVLGMGPILHRYLEEWMTQVRQSEAVRGEAKLSTTESSMGWRPRGSPLAGA